MKILKKFINYFSTVELALWSSSVLLILVSFLIFDKENYLILIASLIGATALIFCAKGNPFGQVAMIVFSSIYGYISFSYQYYGEVLTYLGMTAPMAIFSLISWLRHPYNGKKSQVKIKKLKGSEAIIMSILTIFVTVIFYFVLKTFGTQNILPSTLSVTTSFIAVFLTYKRSALYALAYAVNDIVLIVLWVLAAIEDISYLSVIICFIMFLINDLYGFINWQRLYRRQNKL